MRKIDVNVLAGLIVICGTLCLIAAMYFTTFERHHTHDWPQEQVKGGIADAKFSQHSRYQENLQVYSHKSQIFIAVFTGFGILVAIAGLVLIGLTLRATSDTLNEAKLATEAARESVSVTRDIGQRQVQAYVCVTWARTRGYIESNSTFLINIGIMNSGASPAYSCNVEVKVDFVTTAHLLGLSDGEPQQSIRCSGNQVLNIVAATNSYQNCEIIINNGQAPEPQDVGFAIFEFEISWQDVFGVEHSLIQRGLTRLGESSAFYETDVTLHDFGNAGSRGYIQREYGVSIA